MADISIKYRNAEIANMSASGSKTLQTAGKYCDSDIVIDYVRPSGGGGVDLVYHSGTFTPAANTSVMSITGLGAPAFALRFAITENGLDGTAKVLSGVFLNGTKASSRTNAAGTSRVADLFVDYNISAFPNRTVYTDGTGPTGSTINATETGFYVNTGSSTYNFKAGYTYIWECWTLPED